MTTHEFDIFSSSPRHGIAGKRSQSPVEPLSTRVTRLRIGRGYSVSDLAAAAGIFAGTVRRLESGRPVDKRVLAPLATALRVPLCRLVCGEHSCAERACVPSFRAQEAPDPLRCGPRRLVCGLVTRGRDRDHRGRRCDRASPIAWDGDFAASRSRASHNTRVTRDMWVRPAAESDRALRATR
jgi:transcriptional regulator with XRE-family HTH domain